MAQSWDGRWREELVPMTVLVPQAQQGSMMARGAGAGVLESLYDEAMARFDAFCFWYGRPARSLAGMREVAKRLEAYGSPEALRLAEAVRAALSD